MHAKSFFSITLLMRAISFWGLSSSSSSSSSFFSCLFEGQETLDACLAAYFAEEELKGDNQYQCGRCNEKQDASRGVKLMEMPAVLSLYVRNVCSNFEDLSVGL